MLWDQDVSARAFLFDMDGTLVDSTAVVERLWGQFAAHFEVDAAEVLAFAHGRRTPDTVRRFVADESAGDDWLVRQEREELDALDGIVEVPGAAAFLAQLSGVPLAVVTSAPRELAVRRLRAAGLVAPEVLVAAEDVSHGKPDPEGYAAAAARLGVPITDCVVVEDAPAGLTAGLEAGAVVVEITGGREPSGLTAHAVEDYTRLRAVRSDGSERVVLRLVQH